MRAAAVGLALGFSLAQALAVAGCASSSSPDQGLEGLAIEEVAPETIIPGSKVVIKGASFVDSQWGTATVHLTGNAGGQQVDVRWGATFVDFNTMTVAIDSDEIDELGGDVDFHGTARIDVIATSDGDTYSSDAITIDLRFREKLTPTPTALDGEGVIFVNDQIQIEGDGFLLGGDEGVSVAKLTGCFTLDNTTTCKPIAAIEIPLVPVDPLKRTRAQFPFSPKVAGIKSGTFTGAVTVINKQMRQSEVPAEAISVLYDLVTSQIFSVDPPAASLGQYVFINGGGFVGGEPGALTEIELAGTFNKTGGSPASISMTLIPEFVEGRMVRYVVNTDDELGQSLDLRVDTGSFTGTATAIVSYGVDRVRGASKRVAFAIAPVKQVVYLNFQASYVEGLRDFGLRAVDKRIRDRIIEVCKRAFEGVNVEFRTEPPTDYALYEHVELVGVDPNGTGLFGYDNSPGKDNGNLRLYDRLGGVNALTQQDGYPGYGGVFVRSLMGFSKHPVSGVKSVPGADSLFDKMFDPFRPDQGGQPIRAADLSGNVPVLTEGTGCPASSREGQVGCAILVLGNLVGGTLSHEIGHSLGLANPYMEGFHNAGDAPNRLMDSGGDRPFVERAELEGKGPGVFCDDEYAYLRMILPVSTPAPSIERPGCF
ncbi:MAG: hypothetical protein H0T89_28585 [Deltaproteobacteria bacterium]|nr:hypothetical protein [Deltaproteobacteria bacterium]MDQ3300063.1 hypothetical protein [Myxococcota bacterium]